MFTRLSIFPLGPPEIRCLSVNIATFEKSVPLSDEEAPDGVWSIYLMEDAMGLLGPNFKTMEHEGDIEGLRQAFSDEQWKTREIAAAVLDRFKWKPENNEN